MMEPSEHEQADEQFPRWFCCRLLSRPDPAQQRIELRQLEGDYDDILNNCKWLVEQTGRRVRAEDLDTGRPIVVVEILPTHRNYHHVADWDGDGWVHRMERRIPMA